jgi:SEC-C motif-containing protein
MNNLCPCGSGTEYEYCCQPLLMAKRSAATPEELMRSRYTAYVKKNKTLHPDLRKEFDPKATLEWAENSNWQKLEILKAEPNIVEFVATYTENGILKKHHEISVFQEEAGCWYYVGAKRPEIKPFVRETAKVGRNDKCPCGSGKKYKQCCVRTS